MQKAQEENTNCNCSELISRPHLFLSHIPVYDQDHQRRGISCSLPAAATKFRRMYSTSVVQLGLQGLLDYLITTGDSSTIRNNCPPCALFIPSMCPPRAPGVFDIGSSTQRNNDVLLRIGCKPTLGPHIRIQNQTSFVLLFVATYLLRFFQKYILTYFLFCTHPFEPQYKEQGDHKYVKVHSYVFSLLHPSFSTSIPNPLTIRFPLDPKL